MIFFIWTIIITITINNLYTNNLYTIKINELHKLYYTMLSIEKRLKNLNLLNEAIVNEYAERKTLSI